MQFFLPTISHTCETLKPPSGAAINMWLRLVRSIHINQFEPTCAALKMKFSIKHFFSKCDQISSRSLSQVFGRRTSKKFFFSAKFFYQFVIVNKTPNNEEEGSPSIFKTWFSSRLNSSVQTFFIHSFFRNWNQQATSCPVHSVS